MLYVLGTESSLSIHFDSLITVILSLDRSEKPHFLYKKYPPGSRVLSMYDYPEGSSFISHSV